MDRFDLSRARMGVVLLLLLALAACGEPPSLNGVVRDNFGQPVADVVVSIPNTDSSTKTDAAGVYKLPYSTGQLTLSFVRDGYQAETVPFSATSRGQLTVEDVVLFKRITQQGIFVVGKTNYFGPIRNCQINVLMIRDNVEVGYDRITAGGVDPALIDLAEIALPVVLVENFLPMPPSAPQPLMLLYNRYDRPEIGRITLRATPEPSSQEVAVRPIDTGAEFGRWLQTDIMDVGTFAYAMADPATRLPRPGSLCYLFQFR